MEGIYSLVGGVCPTAVIWCTSVKFNLLHNLRWLCSAAQCDLHQFEKKEDEACLGTFCGSIKIRALFKAGISVPKSTEGLLGALNLENDKDEQGEEDGNDEVDYKMTISDENDDDDDDKIRSLWSEWRSAN